MVSEKVIVILLIVAIVLSVASIALTLSLNMDNIKSMENTSPAGEEVTSDSSSGQVQLVVGGENGQ